MSGPIQTEKDSGCVFYYRYIQGNNMGNARAPTFQKSRNPAHLYDHGRALAHTDVLRMRGLKAN